MNQQQPSGILTVEQIVALCTRLQPEQAAERSDSSLCVTELIQYILVDDEIKELRLVNGKWGALYIRVSSEKQRSGKSGIAVADGFSEEEQLVRGIRYFASKGLAVKIYSDAGMKGDYPTNDQTLIKRLLCSRATRYRKIFTRTMLDETSVLRRTPEQVASMRAYLERRVAKIMQGALTDDEIEDSEELNERERRGLRGRPRRKVFFRQALTQMWNDVENNQIHTLAASDRSRLCRAADMESALLEHLSLHETRLFGLIEDMSSLDVSDPIKKGYTYLIASINEYRLEEISGHCFRGFLQRLESGYAHGAIPWWLRRKEDETVEFVAGCDVIVRKIVDLYLCGLGHGAIASQLHTEGIRVKDKSITARQISYLLESDALSGVQWHFGLAWHVFPIAIEDADLLSELRERRKSRRDYMGKVNEAGLWANHLFTGVCKCSCGGRMSFSHPAKNNPTSKGYYMCSIPHKRINKDARHAWVNEAKLEAFISSVLRHNPNLLTGMLEQGAGTANSRKAAQRALLQERLREAEAGYKEKERTAHDKAAGHVQALGISVQSPAYEAVVSETVKGLLEQETVCLNAIRQELTILGTEIAQERKTARLAETVEQLKGWDNLNTITKNRLLRCIIETITVYPMHNGGYLEIKLVGVDTPLPPVRMHRIKGRDVRLPTVQEWINDMFGLSGEDEVILHARHMRSFFTFMGTVQEDNEIGKLADRIRRDEDFPRRARSQYSIVAHLQKCGMEAELQFTLAQAWERYLEAERARLKINLQSDKE